jgi:ABC-2 type transport system permease protein
MVYFVLAYFMFASMMAAIGAAVNDLREAQSLMTPVMLTDDVAVLLLDADLARSERDVRTC